MDCHAEVKILSQSRVTGFLTPLHPLCRFELYSFMIVYSVSRENFFQVLPPLELEGQTGSKIFSEDYVTGGTFLRHW